MSFITFVTLGSVVNTGVVETLKNPGKDKVCLLPPVKPKGGEIFLFSPLTLLVSRGQTLFQRRGLSIRDYYLYSISPALK